MIKVALLFLFLMPGTALHGMDVPNRNEPAGEPGTAGKVLSYPYSPSCPPSSAFCVKAENREVFVYSTSAGAFAAFDFKGQITIEIETEKVIRNVRIAPARNGIKAVISGNKISFSIDQPRNLLVEIDGLEQLFLYANAMDEDIPDPSAKGVRYFKAGQIYEIGELRLNDNETLYIEGGAVVRGSVRATSVKNVCVAGHGILDGGYYQRGTDGRRSIVFEGCENSVIKDIIMIEPSSWMIVLGACRNILVNNVKELGSEGSTDGADIVGSQQIRIENCFFRNGDDCIAIKALDLRNKRESITLDFSRDVKDIEIKGCAFLAYIGGQAMEIGHELRTDSVSNIRFIDCDVLGVHGQGGVFGIHNSDHAAISHVLYENIRVEHYYNKLVDFRIIKSRYFKDPERGQAQDIILRNIDVTVSEFNPGYSVSIIGGYDATHRISKIVFDNFKLNDKRVLNADQLDLFTREVSEISFR